MTSCAPGEPALTVEEVWVSVRRGRAQLPTVTDVALSVAPGEALGLVGESGSGKSLTLRAIAGILPLGTVSDGMSLRFGTAAAHRLAMVFQEPLAAMSPTTRVVDLIAQGAMAAGGLSKRAARQRALELMAEVAIPDREHRARMWPHELSGGLRQRVVIAMALATDPTVLLCDEPTTALDVTVQDQILGLLDRLRRERGMALIFVTHDLAVVSTMCQRTAVMYAGQVVEVGDTTQVLAAPRHPYTAALLAASRSRSGDGAARPIGGTPPDPAAYGEGCRFLPRCPAALERCETTPYTLAHLGGGHTSACVRVEELTTSGPALQGTVAS